METNGIMWYMIAMTEIVSAFCYIYNLFRKYVHVVFNETYTTVQKFGVIQTISCLPWKLTFIYQMNWKLNRKYSQDIDKVRNND